MNKNNIFLLCVLVIGPMTILGSIFLKDNVTYPSEGVIFEKLTDEQAIIPDLDYLEFDESFYIDIIDAKLELGEYLPTAPNWEIDIKAALPSIQQKDDGEVLKFDSFTDPSTGEQGLEVKFIYQTPDLSQFPIDYFDVYLYADFKTDILNPNTNISLQKLTVKDSYFVWEDIAVSEGVGNPIHVAREFCDKTLMFRIYGTKIGSTTKYVEIDRLRVILAHSNENSVNFFENRITASFSTSDIDPYTYANNLGVAHALGFQEDLNWWDEATGLNKKVHARWNVDNSRHGVENSMYLNLYVNLTIDPQSNGGNIMMERINPNTYDIEYGISVNDLDEYKVSMKGNVYCINPGFGYPTTFEVNLLKNDGQDERNVFYDSGRRYYPANDDPYMEVGVPYGIELNLDPLQYINEDGEILFNTESYLYALATSNIVAHLQTELYWVRLRLDVEGYGFTDQDFPEVVIQTNPVSNFPDKPISHLSTDFTIQSNIQSMFGTNTIADNNVEIYIQGDSWNSGWIDMNRNIGTNIWNHIVDPQILEDGFGDYSVWVRTTDSGGLYTLESYDFRYDNEAPNVDITFPANDEVIKGITDYTFSVEIYDLENNLLNYPSALYQIYDANEAPLLDGWKPLLVGDQPDHIDYTKGESGVYVYIGIGSFNPVSFGEGDYTFIARVEDAGYSIYIEEHFGYGEANFTISNEQPQIEFIDPDKQDPESRQIKELYDYTVNISIDEEETLYTVEMMIYHDDPNNPTLDWTPMNLIEDGNYPEKDNWSLSIDPIDYGLGYYTIVVKATDAYGTSDNSIIVLFPNERPVIAFNSPLDGQEISQLYDYMVNTTVIDPEGNPISDVGLMIYNETMDEQFPDRLIMTQYQSTDYWNVSLDLIDLPFGDYTFNVSAADALGYGMKIADVTFYNYRPYINFKNPNNYDLETVEDVYDYIITVDVVDPEDDEIGDVSIRLLNSTDDPVIDWTDMTQVGLTDTWTFLMDPINYPMGVYTIEVNATDTAGYNINQTKIIFQRYPPKIELEIINTIREFEAYHNIRLNFTKGAYSAANFTWYISEGYSDIYPIKVLLSDTIDTIPGQTEYIIPIEPKDLPNGDFIFSIIVQNHTGHRFYYPDNVRDVEVDYFIENTPQNQYYTMNTEVSYKSDGVIVNSFIRGDVVIDYLTYLGYNYKFEVRSNLQDLIFGYDPDFQIQRAGSNNPYRTLPDVGGISFEFREKLINSEDHLSFNIKTPTFGPIEEDQKPETGILDDGREFVEIEVKLTSHFDFTDIHCSYEPMIPIREAGTYAYTLYIQENGEWVKTDIDLDFEGDLFEETWSFTIPSIKAGDEIHFKIYGVRVDVEEFDYAPLIYGAIFAGLFCAVWMLLGRKRILKMKIFKTRPWLFWVVGVAAAVGIVAGVYFGVVALEASIGNYIIYTK